jgi:hypothetical protein
MTSSVHYRDQAYRRHNFGHTDRLPHPECDCEANGQAGQTSQSWPQRHRQINNRSAYVC